MEETLKILVIDDNEVDRMAVRLALTNAGVYMELCEVSDIHNALSALKNTNFDCVFLDYRLPNQDSLILINKLRSSEIKVPLVILTDPEDEQLAIELIAAGATDYLVKSKLSAETLAQILRSAIRLYSAQIKADLAYKKLKESHEQLINQNQELEKQRQQIQAQNLQLLETSRLKSQFLATISHELRTPMNAIIGFSQILLRPKFGQLTHQQADMVERILNNGKHLLILLNEVLDFSKLESGRLELKPEIFDFSKIVNNTVLEIRSLAEAKKLSLFVDIDLENTLVFNDPIRVHQILINLLSNAIKFTEHGSIWLEVKEIISRNRITITIRDTGIGISPQDFQNIFEAFRQIDQGISRKYPGTGLGLAIINSLVKMMGGKIFLESQLGVGSIFKIELPRQITLLPSSHLEHNYSLNLSNGDGFFYSSQNPSEFPSQFSKAVMGYLHF
ncbi:ATP-binding protein [Anabaena cylindrica UHCC 0172]|uniref:ATP-binding response regulator n=1 Tax=Anabaena cylindrica TaxID=1165 RepID=UPI002B1F7A7D|nr:ATP-binding protein [Anabaena cylindrica]MEA5550465.1 ATP-binding protein [Anabaena cylindrica UHCC 0172]